jgi:outer membrane receptor protein involved in Fe transport
VAGGALGRLWWRDLTVQWYFNQRDKDIPTGSFETIFGDPRAETFDRRAFVEVRYEPVLSDVAQLFTRLYYDHTRYEGTFPYPADEAGVNTESYEGDWLGAELRSVFRPLAGMRLTAGAEYQLHFRSTAEGSSENEGVYLDEEHPFHVLSVYGVADWAPLEWLAVSAGARFDGWWIDALRRADGSVSDRFMSSVNPRLALLFHPVAESTLKLLGGRAFRAPSIYELTYWDGGLTQVQSPELEPEVIWTGEVEYSHRLPADLTVTGSFFLNNIADLIEQAGGGTSEDPLRYVNQADDVWTLGGEVELSHELRQGWMFMAQYSVQHTRVGDVFDGQRLKNAPEHLGALKVVAPLARPEVLLANRLVVESGRLDREGDETDVALLWDLVLSGQVQAAHLRYAAGVRNLLDWRVAHPVGEDLRDVTLRQPGRTFFVDLSLHW